MTAAPRHKSKIEWLHWPGYVGATWNPVVGCAKVNTDCIRCYAIRSAWRLQHNPHPAVAAKFAGLVEKRGGKLNWTGEARLWPAALELPLKTRRPHVWFVDELADLFYEGLSDAEIAEVFAVMALSPQHVFVVLTKRPARAAQLLTARFDRAWSDLLGTAVARRDPTVPLECLPWPLPNVIVGASAGHQAAVDAFAPHLETLKRAGWATMLSAEPLTEALDLDALLAVEKSLGVDRTYGFAETVVSCRSVVDWVVAGGESGPDARPCHPDWARGIRDECREAVTWDGEQGVPFLWKQWGTWTPDPKHVYPPKPELVGEVHDWKDEWVSVRVGKKRAGRTLDGVIEHGLPVLAHREAA